jgi:hypothetical protein
MGRALPHRQVWSEAYPWTVLTPDQREDAPNLRLVGPAPLLSMGCAAQSGRPTGGGRLIIEPGAVRFEFNAAAVKLGVPPVIQARPPLILMHARLLPPGFNSGLIMHGDEGTVTVFTWCGRQARVRRALADAEVAFVLRASWLSVGRAESANSGVK